MSPLKQSGAFPKAIVQNSSFSFHAINWVIIGLYLFAILVIGLYFFWQQKYKKSYLQTSQNFFTASASLPGWATGFSLFATSLSAITFLAVPAATFAGDWIIMIGALTAPAFAPFLIKYIVPFFRKLQAKSGYEYVQIRFGLHLRLFVSVLFILFQTARAAIVIYLPTIAISTIIPSFNPYIVATIVTLITVLYSYLGGIRSVIWTDLAQGIILSVSLLVMIFWTIGLIDNIPLNQHTTTSGSNGFAASSAKALSNGKFLASGHWVFTLGGLGIPLVFLSFFVNAIFPIVGGQDVVQRYQSTKNKYESDKAIIINSSLTVIVGTLMFYGFGTLLYQYFSATNQVAYDVGNFSYNNQNISMVWLAHNMPNQHAYGYNSVSKTWIILSGNTHLTNFEWNNITLDQIQALSQQATQLANGGNLVRISAIVSPYDNFAANNYIVSNGNVVPYFIATILPTGVSGFIIAGILAAAQSSISSSYSAAARCFVEDIVVVYYPNLKDKTKLVIGQGYVVFVGLFSLAITLLLIYSKQDAIFLFFNAVIGLFGAAILALFFMGIFGNYIRNNAAIFGVYLGFAVAIVVFLLSNTNFMQLFGAKPLLNNAWVAVFSFAITFISAYAFQYFATLIRIHKTPYNLIYQKPTKLGLWCKINANKIKIIASFGLAHWFVKNICFEPKTPSQKTYVVLNNKLTLNKFGSKLYQNQRINQQQINHFQKYGLGWIFIMSNTPKTDQQYYKRIQNYSLKNLDSYQKKLWLGERLYNQNLRAYQKYVKRLYSAKLHYGDLNLIEQKQQSFIAFVQQTCYQRYLIRHNFKNRYKLKKWQKPPLTFHQIHAALKLFLTSNQQTKIVVTNQKKPRNYP